MQAASKIVARLSTSINKTFLRNQFYHLLT